MLSTADRSLISIIINCFNGEKYLNEALKSILNQTYKNWEIIFWDNQSSDSSEKVFKQYKDERFKYFYATQHTTLYAARNKALEKCKGEYIAFLDVDDWWEETKLEKQIKVFFNGSFGLVYSNSTIHNQINKSKKIFIKDKLPSGEVTNQILSNYPIGISTVMINKNILKNGNLLFDSRYSIIGDFDLFVNLSLSIKFYGINEPLSNYRLHESNYTNKNTDQWLEEFETWLNINDNKFKEKFNESLNKVRTYLSYLKVKFKILKGNYRESFIDIVKFPLKIEKLKLFCILILLILNIKKNDDFK